MSKGSAVVVVRIPLELEAAMNEAIEAANAVTKEEPYNRSSWLRKCITDRLKHLQRGRGVKQDGNTGGKAKSKTEDGAGSEATASVQAG